MQLSANSNERDLEGGDNRCIGVDLPNYEQIN